MPASQTSLGVLLVLAASGWWWFRSDAPAGPTSQAAPPGSGRMVQPASPVPLFVEGRGQWDTPARFVGSVGGILVRAEPGALALQLAPPSQGRDGILVRFRFEGASAGASIEGELPREALFSYFLGNDPSRWIGGARSFDAVRYRGLYPGIDLLLHARRGSFEYDLELEAGADPSRFQVVVEGAEGIEIGEGGALVVRTSQGPLVQSLPRSFQPLPDGSRRELASRCRVLGADRFGFEVEDRKTDLPLVVDPSLLWSTYIGTKFGFGVGDIVWSAAVGPGGDVYVGGQTEGPQFPTTPGTFASPGPDGVDVFVARFRGSDGALLYSSVIGGSFWQERPLAIEVDSLGQATVGGWTDSHDFPSTQGAFQTQNQSQNNPGTDSFLLRLSAQGDQLVYSTFFGGKVYDQITSLDLAPTGAAVVGGITTSSDLPVTPGAWQTTFSAATHGFVARFDPTGSTLEWSTWIDSEVEGVALDAQGNITVAGDSVSLNFPVTPGAWAPGGRGVNLFRLDSSGSQLIWSSVFGTNTSNGMHLEGFALDAFGSPIVMGWTLAQDFPTTPGALFSKPNGSINSFLVRLEPNGSNAIYSTYLGQALGRALAMDSSGVASLSVSPGQGFPFTPGAYKVSPILGADIGVARIDPYGRTILYSTLIGGPGTDDGYAIAISPTRRVSVGGRSTGGYPTTPGAPYPNYIGGQTDAVVTTLDLVLEGLELKERSVPACIGPLHANGTEMPVAGSTRFAFFCSGAPPSASGWLVVGQASPSGVQVGGVTLGLTPTAARIPVHSDAYGWVETPYPLTGHLPGDVFAVQYLFQNPAACSGPKAWSTSNVVAVTVQPPQ